MFVHRRRREDRFLEWKVWIFSLAAALVLVGIYMDARWMTGTALALLLGAMLLRFLPGGVGGSLDADDDEEDEDEDGSQLERTP